MQNISHIFWAFGPFSNPPPSVWTSHKKTHLGTEDSTVQTDEMAFQMGDRLHTTVLKITAGTEGEGGGGDGRDGRGCDQATHLVFFCLLSKSKAISYGVSPVSWTARQFLEQYLSSLKTRNDPIFLFSELARNDRHLRNGREKT